MSDELDKILTSHNVYFWKLKGKTVKLSDEKLREDFKKALLEWRTDSLKEIVPEKKPLNLEDYKQEDLDNYTNQDISVLINFRQGWNGCVDQILNNIGREE